MDVDIKDLPALRVAAVRHMGPYTRINEAFERLGEVAGAAGLIKPPSVQMIALYYDDPESTPENELTSDAGIIVSENVALSGGLEERRVPAGTFACAVYVGPYESLPDAWGQLMGEWLPASGRTFREGAPSCELYLNDPSTTPKEELRTEIRIPV